MKILLLIGLLLSCQLVQAQARPGFYMTMDMDMDMEMCDHKMKMINTNNILCLSEEPVIELGSFERVDELVLDSISELRQFRIVLTKKGSDFVETIASKLPDHQLALVVNGILVSLINLEGVQAAQSILIWDLSDSQSIDWIHKSLVDSVTKYQKKS